MSLRAAFEVLAGIAVSGVGVSYDLDQVPWEVGDLPVLVPVLVSSQEGQDTQALQVLTYDEEKWWATFYVQHVCYLEHVSVGSRSEVLPGAITLVDDYLAAVAGNPYLSGNLDEPLTVLSVEFLEMRFPPHRPRGPRFYAVRFVQRWKMEVTAAS